MKLENILMSFKKFFSNKNTVTIIGVLVGILILYLGYNWRVKQAITPISVPYAKVEISSRTLITSDMIGYTQVPKSMANASKNLVTNSGLVVGKYVSYGSTIPANSLFYSEALMSAEEQPDSAFADIPDGYTIYSLGVNTHTTYGNSIYPGNYIDLYLKAIDDTGKIIYAKLIESIEVLAVKDSNGEHVFESTVETRSPAELLFAVPDDMYLLLMKAEYITTNQVEVVPVPRNAAYSANPGETLVKSSYLKEFILAKTTYVPEDVTTNPTTETTDTTNTPTTETTTTN